MIRPSTPHATPAAPGRIFRISPRLRLPHTPRQHHIATTPRLAKEKTNDHDHEHPTDRLTAGLERSARKDAGEGEGADARQGRAVGRTPAHAVDGSGQGRC